MAKGQIKGKMDRASELKFWKGAAISSTGAVCVLALLILFGMGIDKATLTAFVGFLIPVITNYFHVKGQGEDPTEVVE